MMQHMTRYRRGDARPATAWVALVAATALVAHATTRAPASPVEHVRADPRRAVERVLAACAPLSPVQINGRYGYIAAAGRAGRAGGSVARPGQGVIAPKFEQTGHFAEGLAPVMIGGKWGFVNRAGDLA